MRTSHPRIKVENYGRENWRTVARDDCGEWAITGPPYPTQAEALANVARVAAEYFGEASAPDLQPWHGNPGLVWLHKRTVPVARAAWNAYQARDWDLSADLLEVADYLEACAGEAPESQTRQSIAATVDKVRTDQARGYNAPVDTLPA